jgi:uncharacterized protein YdeI (YjbR/CyaY-like superfamily)
VACSSKSDPSIHNAEPPTIPGKHDEIAAIAERLIKSGEIAPPGLREVEAAKMDGRWKAAYDSFGNAAVPNDLLKELAENKKAKAFFQTLNKTNLYSIAYRLQTAKKPETREKRIQTIIGMLVRGEKLR